MGVSAFIQRSTGLSPEARILLARLLYLSLGRAFELKDAVEAGRYLSISAALVRRSLAELCEKSLLKPTDVREGKGRPIRCYMATQYCQDLFDEPSIHLKHEWLVQRVLLLNAVPGLSVQGQGATGRSGLSERLTASNRLLLCILLINANLFGVVRWVAGHPFKRRIEITEGYLASAMNLSRSQIQAQMYKLSWLGFIRFRLSGFSQGERHQTIYFLNLHHPVLVDGHSSSSVFVVRGISPVLAMTYLNSRQEEATRERVLFGIDARVADLLSLPDLTWELRLGLKQPPAPTMRLSELVGLRWPDYADVVLRLALSLRQALAPHIGSSWSSKYFCLLPASSHCGDTRVVLVRSMEHGASESARVICCGGFPEPAFIEPEFAQRAGVPGLTAYGLYRPFRPKARHHSPKARTAWQGI